MIIGSNYVFLHLPKTGGDAAAQFISLLDPAAAADSAADPKKHDLIRHRPGARAKQYYLLGIRRLPFWVASYIAELACHPDAMALYGNPQLNKQFALGRPLADENLLRFSEYIHITHWLPMEQLARRVAEFFDAPVERLATVGTKGGRNLGNPFTPGEEDRLYDLNPHWARVEAREIGPR